MLSELLAQGAPIHDGWAAAAALGFGAGIWMFYSGFAALMLKRKIEDTPLSKIRSVAVGLAELQGHAAPLEDLKEPILLQPCVYYKINIEIERIKRVKNANGQVVNLKYWSTYQTKESSAPFTLHDDTGVVIVFPENADMRININNYCYQSDQGDFPAQGIDYCTTQGLDPLQQKIRISGQHIRPGDALYVLGYAGIAQGRWSDQEKIAQLISKVKANPGEYLGPIKSLDMNQDSHIDEQEMSQAVSKEADKLLEQNKETFCELVISEGSQGIFIISDSSEKETIAALSIQSPALLIVGPTLTLLSAVVIFKYLSQ